MSWNEIALLRFWEPGGTAAQKQPFHQRKAASGRVNFTCTLCVCHDIGRFLKVTNMSSRNFSILGVCHMAKTPLITMQIYKVSVKHHAVTFNITPVKHAPISSTTGESIQRHNPREAGPSPINYSVLNFDCRCNFIIISRLEVKSGLCHDNLSIPTDSKNQKTYRTSN